VNGEIYLLDWRITWTLVLLILAGVCGLVYFVSRRLKG
jgi:hypothetical protein